MWKDPKTGYVRRQIFSSPSHPLEITAVEMPPGKSVTFSGLVLRQHAPCGVGAGGRTGADRGPGTHLLKAGDSLGFGPPSDVTYANESKKPCRYIVALTRG